MNPGHKLQAAITERFGTVAEFGRQLARKGYESGDRVARDWIKNKKFGPKQWAVAADVLGLPVSHFFADDQVPDDPSSEGDDGRSGYASLERYLKTARAAKHSPEVIAELRAYRRSDGDPGDALWPHLADGLEAIHSGRAPQSRSADVGAEALARARSATGFEPMPLKPTKTQSTPKGGKRS